MLRIMVAALAVEIAYKTVGRPMVLARLGIER
jgi:hypothetical protein